MCMRATKEAVLEEAQVSSRRSTACLRGSSGSVLWVRDCDIDGRRVKE